MAKTVKKVCLCEHSCQDIWSDPFFDAIYLIKEKDGSFTIRVEKYYDGETTELDREGNISTPEELCERVLYYGEVYMIEDAYIDPDKIYKLDYDFADQVKNYLAEKDIAEYTEAIKLDPKSTLAYFNRGMAYEGLGQLALAEADRQRALELEKE